MDAKPGCGREPFSAPFRERKKKGALGKAGEGKARVGCALLSPRSGPSPQHGRKGSKQGELQQPSLPITASDDVSQENTASLEMPSSCASCLWIKAHSLCSRVSRVGGRKDEAK